jgi:putative membrane protein insertion efficiency factor
VNSSTAFRHARAPAWWAGTPLRLVLLTLVRAYRLTVGKLVGGNCRFHPSCSAYAEDAIRNTGAFRGLALTAWRIVRCSPLSRGGVDYPPTPGHHAWHAPAQQPGAGMAYDADILLRVETSGPRTALRGGVA